jgi:hypothetical protein
MTDNGPEGMDQQSIRHIQFADVKMFQASMAEGEERDILLVEAKDALFKAEQVSPGSGAWKIACLNAHAGKGKLCLEWLERASAKGSLPSKEEIAREPAFAKVRKHKWFRQFLQRRGK